MGCSTEVSFRTRSRDEKYTRKNHRRSYHRFRRQQEIKRLRDRDTFRRLDSIKMGDTQYTWSQSVLCSELRRLGRTVRLIPPQGKKKSKVEFVRVYYDATTDTVHQNPGHDKEFNRLYGWVYRSRRQKK